MNHQYISFFLLLLSIKKNSGVVVQGRIFTLPAKASTDQLQCLKKFYLTFIAM